MKNGCAESNNDDSTDEQKKNGSTTTELIAQQQQQQHPQYDEETQRLLRLADLHQVTTTKLDAVVKLDLFGAGLSSLPDSLPSVVPNLGILFLSNNKFAEVPAVVGACPRLTTVSFRSNRVSRVHPDALRPRLRWLILTDNRLERLPPEIGRCVRLRKLMLSGNALTELPPETAACEGLELARLASNRLTAPPTGTLLSLPNLAWVALSDNPFGAEASRRVSARATPLPRVRLAAVDGAVLGRGAGGVTRRTVLADGTPVAVKRPPEGATTMTSDGDPSEERRAALVAASVDAPCLVRALGQDERDGALVSELLVDFVALGNPPTMDTCTRDVYDDDRVLTVAEATAIARRLADALRRLHAVGLSHGDLYAHNVSIPANGDASAARLTDLGAAFLYDRDAPHGALVERVETRAYGHLVAELADLTRRSTTDDPASAERSRDALRRVSDACLRDDDDGARTFAAVEALLRETLGEQSVLPVVV